MKLLETIKQLNADVSDITNQEKAKKLRKKLMLSGGILAAVGVIGMIICFGLAGIEFIGMSNVENGLGKEINFGRILVPFCVGGMLSFLVVGGLTLFFFGLRILITGKSTQFINKSINNICSCGNTLNDDEIFCSKCGKIIRKTCSMCGEVQEIDSEFCKKCGTKL